MQEDFGREAHSGHHDAHGQSDGIAPVYGCHIQRYDHPKGEAELLVGFFEEQQAAAVLKHGILRRYLHVFASKTGSASPENRVYYLDGYAGAGSYDDGTPGSPALAAQTATAISSFRNLHCIYVERDRKNFDRLVMTLDGVEHDWEALLGSVEYHLDGVLAKTAGCPLFAFLDPFGLGIPMDQLTGKVLARGGPFAPPTEVLLNFSMPGLYRTAGHLTSEKDYAARPSFVAKLDAYLGGDWWHSIWISQAEDRHEQIVRGYVDRLKERGGGGWGWWIVPVSNRWDGPTIYCLIFMSHHPDGIWEFNQNLSLASEEYYAWCHRGQLELETPQQRWARWSEEIKGNLELLLPEAPFRVQARMKEIYGAVVGVARDRHIRAALKALHAEGKTATTGVGAIQDMLVLPP
jgi:three-Cys-motif partner protein